MSARRSLGEGIARGAGIFFGSPATGAYTLSIEPPDTHRAGAGDQEGVGAVHKFLRKLSRRLIYERRAAMRHAVSRSLRFRIRSGSKVSEAVPAQARDLSTTGLSIETSVVRSGLLHVYDSADMVTPTRLEVELELPGGVVSLVGETVRYDRVQPGLYLLGVRIVEMDERDRALYLTFVETLG